MRCQDCVNFRWCDDEDKGVSVCEAFEKKVRRQTPYERTKAQVYATGNKWAIENFHATHD